MLRCVTPCYATCENFSVSMQEENEDGELLGFNIVATKLLGIVTAPIHLALATKLPQVRSGVM